MTNKQQPGDRCQVVTAHGQRLDATIISTREGHGGALVRVDGWVTDVWAKPSEIRDNPVNPTSQKRGDYTPNQLVEVQYTQGRWVDGNFSHWEDDTHERAYVATDQSGFGSDRFHYTNIRPARVAPDPHSTAYQGEVGDHQPRTTETVAKYGHVATDDAVGVFAGGHIHPTYAASVTPHFTIHNDGRVQQNLAIRDDFSEVTLLADKLAPLGVSYDEQRKFIDAMAEFAKCGVTPEQVMEYVDAFARLIVTGATPEEVERFARQTLLDRASNPDAGLHHITREYRGAR
ncbi:hypothetical protein DFO58_2181 [Arthrobacter sp. AG1021]|uniref:hypothetical protein n=1 Tax=Arthrobacter sp. AG1021 TaxID=2183908 RepID=UPI000EABEE23|nr:hypothetical protein [Arthrobacter sp. AG1021]RKS19679.1 hypothetical protein DFO58_2181 [Arthrobacter sp. AG1021]